MLIDCDTCAVRGLACRECVMTVILGNTPTGAVTEMDWDDAERDAVSALAEAGLVPSLRLVPKLPERRQGIA